MGKCIIFCAAGFDSPVQPIVETDFVIALKGLDPTARYELTSAESHNLLTFAGEQLLAGIPLHLEKKAADLWFYSKV